MSVRAHWETWRPYTLGYAGLVGLAGAALAGLDSGRPPQWPDLLVAWAAPTLGWLAGLYGGDYFDRRLDAVGKPGRPIPSGRMRARTALLCMVALAAAGAALGLAVNWRTLPVAVLTLVCGIGYNIVFKGRGISGNVVRGSLTTAAFVFGAMTVQPWPGPELLLPAVAFLLHDVASNVVGALRDVESDRAAGCRTLPVRRGVRAALRTVRAAYFAGWAAALVSVLLTAADGRGHLTAAAACLGAAGLLGSLALVRLRAHGDQVDPQDALRAHKVLTVERISLAGALIGLGLGWAVVLPAVLGAAGLTLAAQSGGRRELHDLATGAADGQPADVRADEVLAWVERQLALFAADPPAGLRGWRRRVRITLERPDLTLTLLVEDGLPQLTTEPGHATASANSVKEIAISTSGAVFAEVFWTRRTTARAAYLRRRLKMDAEPADMIRLNQLFNEFLRRTPEQQPTATTSAAWAAPAPRMASRIRTVERPSRQASADAEAGSQDPQLPPRVVVSDTTLRDGEQMPGAAFTTEQKVMLARSLDSAGVPLIEVGFPAVSAAEADAARQIVGLGLDAAIQVIARPRERDIDAAEATGAHSIALFAGTSDTHVEAKLRTTHGRLLKQIDEAVRHAKSTGRQVVFAAEDATRSDFERLLEVCLAAAEAGADALGLADTAGVAEPWSYGALVRRIVDAVPLPVAAHCHNDLGLAVANSLSALLAGASGVQCSLLGIGERAGNAPLEELVLALEVAFRHSSGVDPARVAETALLAADLLGHPVAPSKPVVGANAFVHESGLHVDGVLADPSTYEPYPPELTGRQRRLVYGKHSGRRAVAHALEAKGVRFDDRQLAAVVARVKQNGELGIPSEAQDLTAYALTVGAVRIGAGDSTEEHP